MITLLPACLPFFSYGIQFGDLVKLREPGNVFERVLRSSGLRTLRYAFIDRSLAQEYHEDIHGRFIVAGLPHEWHGPALISVLLRNFQDQQRALDCLTSVVDDDIGQWEVDPGPFGTTIAEQNVGPESRLRSSKMVS